MGGHWTLRPLSFGEFPAFDKSALTYNRSAGEKCVVPITGWLLQNSGEVIVVDTGSSSPEMAHRWHHFQIRRSPDQTPDTVLHSLGVPPESVQLIVLTHLHWDHCYGLECFPNARFIVQAEELRSAVDPIPTQRLNYEVGIPGLRPPWLAAFDRFVVVHGDTDLVPGVRVLLLPGHTPGLQGVLVETAAGRHLIASDGAPHRDNFAREGDLIPPGVHTDVAASLRSLERMRQEASVILPSHDSSIFAHSVYPAT